MIREITVRAVWPEPMKGKQEVRTQASTEPSTSRCVLSLTTASSDVQLWVAYPLRTPPRVGDWKPVAGPDGVRHEVGSGAAEATCGTGGCHAEGGGVPACGQPAWAVGAAGAEAKAEALQAPWPCSPHRQTGAQSREVVLAALLATA